MINKWLISALLLFAFVIGISSVLSTNAWAVNTWTDEFGTPVTKLSITLGATITPMIGIDEDGEEVGRVAIVAPATLNLVEKRKYQLKVVNASDSTHYFWAPELDGFSATTTRITVDKGKVRNRVAGAPGEEYLTAEMEIRPGGTAVWEFVPKMAGKFKWGCSIPSHADAGVKGEIVVAPEMSG